MCFARLFWRLCVGERHSGQRAEPIVVSSSPPTFFNWLTCGTFCIGMSVLCVCVCRLIFGHYNYLVSTSAYLRLQCNILLKIDQFGAIYKEQFKFFMYLHFKLTFFVWFLLPPKNQPANSIEYLRRRPLLRSRERKRGSQRNGGHSQNWPLILDWRNPPICNNEPAPSSLALSWCYEPFRQVGSDHAALVGQSNARLLDLGRRKPYLCACPKVLLHIICKQCPVPDFR